MLVDRLRMKRAKIRIKIIAFVHHLGKSDVERVLIIPAIELMNTLVIKTTHYKISSDVSPLDFKY